MSGAIRTFGELVETVESYLYDRKDLRPLAPTFVRLSEQRIFRLLRVPANEGVLTVTGLVGNRVVIPSDYLEVKVITYNGRPLERISEQEYLTRMYHSDAGGETRQFCRIANDLMLFRPPDNNGDVAMVYWRDLSGQLQEEGDYNDILRIAPNLYVYGALLEAMPYLAQDERIPVWQTLFDEAMAQINTQAIEAEYAGSTVEVSNAYSDGWSP